MSAEACRVECYSGHRYAQAPRAFALHGVRHLVDGIKDAWRSPEGFGFVVSTAEGRSFTLKYDETRDAWTVTAADAID